MKKRDDSVFSDDVWKTVYGVPTGLGTLLLIFGNEAVQTFGLFLIAGVLGSYLCILFAEWINDQ